MKSMRYHTIILIFTLAAFACTSGIAQISPGDLAEVHAQLEGISNCTKCHTLGSKITNEKCLQCHTELNIRIKSKQGYHSSAVVISKSCITCHSDHHGKTFQIVRFKQETFDHSLTGYKLLGSHAKQECKNCHKTSFISNPAVRTRKFTYLGLSTDCISCHTDYHQKTIANGCANCHGFDAFKPATKFSHTTAHFQLIGKHQDVACVKCHKITTKEGLKFQEFTGIAYKTCINCHEDPHKNQFGKNCADCHSEESFQAIKSSSKFDHSKTNFKLEDKHQQVSCKSCHKGKISDPIKHSKCIDCHKDYHENQFIDQGEVQNCSVCHDTKGFNSTLFNTERHNEGNFKLEGKHLAVTCLACHKKQEKWKFRDMDKRCKDCHKDYHERQFVKQGEVQECSDCHETKGFDVSTFSNERHNESGFRLQGSHLAIPCIACHKLQDKWRFRDIGKKCNECHANIHESNINIKYYPDSTCESCHNPDRWSRVNFDHAKTRYTLSGAHATASCRDCHFLKGPTGEVQQHFAGLTHDCNNCHTNNHNRQFEKDGVTDCLRCHSNVSWKLDNFDHNKTAFKLDGRHEKVACAKCHKPVTEGPITYVLYKIKDTRCESCH